MSSPSGDGLAWYRHFWPWFIVVLLGLSIAASLATVVLAYRGRDPLVRDDWYKDGVAINRDLARVDRARELGIRARLHFDAEGTRALVELRGGSVDAVDTLVLVLSHATRAENDRTVRLTRTADGTYAGPVATLPVGRFHAILEPAAGSGALTGAPATDAWRVRGPFYYTGTSTSVDLDPGS